MTTIYHFNRFVSLSVVEDLSTEAIINAIMAHVFRYRKTKVIESDCGSNYKGAQKILQANDDQRDLADIKWSEIRSRLKSCDIQLVTRGAKMPWVMGRAESANKMVKHVLPYK